MTKKQIKAIFKRFRYFTPQLDYSPDGERMVQLIAYTFTETGVEATKEFDKQVRRFEKEAEIAKNLFNVALVQARPTTLDEKENPHKVTTRQQVEAVITAPSSQEKPYIPMDGINFLPMSKELYDLYLQVYKELKE